MLKHEFSVEQTWNINTTNDIKSNVNNPLLLESRLGRGFPEKKILIMGYGAPYRVERNCYRERLMLFARQETQLSVVVLIFHIGILLKFMYKNLALYS